MQVFAVESEVEPVIFRAEGSLSKPHKVAAAEIFSPLSLVERADIGWAGLAAIQN